MFTIKKQTAGSTCLFFANMSGKTLGTIRKRQYRAAQRERYRCSTFISQYTMEKYKDIYNEANRFYEKLDKQYPTKTKLTTSPEYKAWQASLEKNRDPGASRISSSITKTTTSSTTKTTSSTTKKTTSSTTKTTTHIDHSLQPSIELNIPLMDANEVRETQDTIVFGDIYPTLMEEINPNTLDEIITELQGSDIFNYDEDMCDILNNEIDISMNELSALEKELLKY